MDVEKRSSKGGFLQLFDWNLKSRKKLFSNKPEQSENVKQGKENVDGSTISRLQQVHENGRGPGDWVNSDLHYHGASLVTGDEGCATKAPGVVARLMGLDSLPTSNVAEPDNTISFESQSFRDSYDFYHPTNFPNEHHIVIYESMRNKLDGMARNPLELKLQKMQRPFERFQTEVLPPKSAKPISITHSRLLSPIKSPGFIPPKNAAYIMEAAAKIIDQSPRSSVKGKLPSLGSSSVPLRIQDLKEKMEATRKTYRILETSNKQNPSKHMKRRPSEKGDMHLFKAAEASKIGPQSQKNKEKSVSFAVQTKANAQKRDGLASMGKQSVNQNEHSETKPRLLSKQQPNTRKGSQKKTSSSRSSDVLRQNNQKQNSISNKDKESPKPSISNQKERKVPPPKSDVSRANKVVNKVVVSTSAGTGKVNSVSIDSRKDSSKSGVKKSSAKKHPVRLDNNSVKSAANNAVMSKDEHTLNCDIPVEGSTKWDTVDWKNGLDVVSFTFTSPIKKPLPGSNSSTQAMEKNKSLCPVSPGNDDTRSTNSAASSSGFNIVGSDALSVLLEQKLKELTSRVEISHEDEVGGQSLPTSANSFQDSTCTLNSMNTTSAHTKGLQFDLFRDNSVVGFDSRFSAVDEVALRATESWQGPEEMGDHSSCSNNERDMEFDFRYSSPVSSLEPSRSDASCNSLESNRSYSSEVTDSKWRASTEADEMSDWSSGRTPQLTDGDLDLADSASSSSVGAMRRTDGTTILTSTCFEGLCHWELEYIRSIISNADVMLEEFALGQVHKIMDPNLFDLLESHITESNKNLEEPFKVARKALFDCVEECLEFRCKRVFCGSFKDWAKSVAVFQSTDHLAEGLYREILGWTNMADLMVDEVVDKDMSTQNGKWVQFDTDTFEEGIEIEKEILTSLVDELVGEFFLL